jgi:acetyl-CoA synthetase
VHQAVIAHYVTGRYARFSSGGYLLVHGGSGLDHRHILRIVALLTHGITSIIDEADFDASAGIASFKSKE